MADRIAPRRPRLRGMTLMEVVIAGALSVIATLILGQIFLTATRVAQGNFSQLNAGNASRRFYEHVGFNTRRAQRIVVAPDGLSVEFTLTDDTTRTYTYVDLDDDPLTIMDNRVIYDPTPGDDGDEDSVVSGVTPGPDGWIFSPDNPRPVLIMNFRIGDPDATPGAPSNVVTGPGPQGVDVLSRLTPRNLHLWGGE